MKKTIISILVLSLIISTFVILPVSAEPTITYYVNHDFNTIPGEKEITVTNIASDPTTRKQYEILGESYPWRSADYPASNSPSFSYDPDGDDGVTDPQPYHNTTGYIRTSGKPLSKDVNGNENPDTEELKQLLSREFCMWI